MKSKDQTPDFIVAILNGKANEQQKEMFSAWIKIVENKMFFGELEKINKMSGDLKLFEKFNLKEGKLSVQKKISRGRILRIVSSIQKVAALFFIPILITASWYFFQSVQLKKDIAGMQVVQEIKSQPGVKSHFFLPDGTEVWLNTASSLKFPSIFKGRTRSVKLNGEAYFKVHKDKSKSFVVEANGLEVTALGTAFNLCAYSDDNYYSTTLEEGKVQITNNQKKGINYILNPGEQITFERNIQKYSKSIVDVYNVISWKDGKLIFNETPFREVVLRLGRWFNADIKLTDESIANYRYTATFTNESLDQVMELLKLTAPIDYAYNKREGLESTGFSRKQILISKNPNARIEIKTKK